MSFEPFIQQYNRAQEVFQNLHNTFNECCAAGAKACDVAKETWEYVNDAGQTFTRNVEQWADAHLPKPITEIAKNALKSLPVSIAFFVAPLSVVLGASVVWIVLHNVKGNLFSKETYENIANGVGFGSLAQAGETAINFFQTGNPVAAIATVTAAAVASYCFSRASQSQPEPQPAPQPQPAADPQPAPQAQ
jgi:hypothetical protein